MAGCAILYNVQILLRCHHCEYSLFFCIVCFFCTSMAKEPLSAFYRLNCGVTGAWLLIVIWLNSWIGSNICCFSLYSVRCGCVVIYYHVLSIHSANSHTWSIFSNRAPHATAMCVALRRRTPSFRASSCQDRMSSRVVGFSVRYCSTGSCQARYAFVTWCTMHQCTTIIQNW